MIFHHFPVIFSQVSHRLSHVFPIFFLRFSHHVPMFSLGKLSFCGSKSPMKTTLHRGAGWCPRCRPRRGRQSWRCCPGLKSHRWRPGCLFCVWNIHRFCVWNIHRMPKISLGSGNLWRYGKSPCSKTINHHKSANFFLAIYTSSQTVK